jgi:hypothetical protein
VISSSRVTTDNANTKDIIGKYAMLMSVDIFIGVVCNSVAIINSDAYWLYLGRHISYYVMMTLWIRLMVLIDRNKAKKPNKTLSAQDNSSGRA